MGMTELLTEKDSVALIVCSDSLNSSTKLHIPELISTLSSFGINVVYDKSIYEDFNLDNGILKKRANILMEYFQNDKIKAIFDISGGDLSNAILDYLDFNIIKENQKSFFGYSDLSVLVNAIYVKTGAKTYLYQVRNLVRENKEIQCKNFKETFFENKKSLVTFDYRWIQGEKMEGIVIGGNIRCFLKLAGTEFMPNFKDKILFIEGLSGNVNKMITYLSQLKQIGAFEKCNGVILGTFTEMETKEYKPSIEDIIKVIVDNKNLPIIKTNEIGHAHDSKCIIIGEKLKF